MPASRGEPCMAMLPLARARPLSTPDNHSTEARGEWHGWLLPFCYARRLQLDSISSSMSENENETAPAGEAPPCPKCGGEMWDNRAGRRNPRAPDFKCKDKSCAGVIWPPRDSAAAPPPA